MANDIKTEQRNGVLIVTFNRPAQQNAFNFDMANQFFQAIKLVASDRNIRAVLLRGEGGQFISGLDFGMYGGDVNKGIEHHNELLLPYHSAIRELYGMEKPVVAAAGGKVAGPGLSFLLASDLVLMGTSARVSFGSVALGVTPEGGTSFMLARKAGAAKAAEILMLNKEYDAAAMEKMNLVNQVVDDAQLDAQANELVEQLAQGPTKAYGSIKKLVAKAFEQDFNVHLGLEHTYWGAAVRSFDFRTAIKGHFAKQPVKFTGA